jgi:voltage-gated potassium channel
VVRRVRATVGQLPQNVIRAALLLASVLVIGTVGYMILEGWSFLDSLYMTVIVLTTIGFHEVRPLDDSGRIFTIVLAIVGVGGLLYALLAMFQFLIEGEFGNILGLQRMTGQIERVTDHYILCGYGRVGEEIARELSARQIQFVVIETTPTSVERARAQNHLLVVGDATSDEILRQAGILRARCLLAASDSDSGNTFITLTAKALNPEIFVVARASRPESQPRMTRAGADRVFSPYVIAGRHMAISALHPVVVEFIDTLATGAADEPVLAEIAVTDESGLAGQTVGEILQDAQTVVVLGVQKRDGQVTVGPALSTLAQAGDRIIVMGREDELEAVRPGSRPLRSRQQPPAHHPPRTVAG